MGIASFRVQRSHTPHFSPALCCGGHGCSRDVGQLRGQRALRCCPVSRAGQQGFIHCAAPAPVEWRRDGGQQADKAWVPLATEAALIQQQTRMKQLGSGSVSARLGHSQGDDLVGSASHAAPLTHVGCIVVRPAIHHVGHGERIPVCDALLLRQQRSHCSIKIARVHAAGSKGGRCGRCNATRGLQQSQPMRTIGGRFAAHDNDARNHQQ